MKEYKVIIISPNPKSLITTSVCELLLRKGVKIQAVFVKKFTLQRFRQEFNRDGKRLLWKIWRKLILKEKAYKDFSDVENILDYREKNDLHLINVKELAKEKIPIHFVNDINSKDVETEFKKLRPDLVVFTGGGLIRENILKNSGAGVVNCHMGILPEYRGMDVVEWPIIHKDFDKIGITIHFMEKGIDTGDIIWRYRIPIKPKETIKSLRIRFEPYMVENMVYAVTKYLNGELKREKQNESEGKQFFIMDEILQKIAASNLNQYCSKL